MNLLNIFRTPVQIKAREQRALIKTCRQRIEEAKIYINDWEDIPYTIIEDSVLEILCLPKNKGCRDFCMDMIVRNDIDQLAEDMYLQQQFHNPYLYAK